MNSVCVIGYLLKLKIWGWSWTKRKRSAGFAGLPSWATARRSATSERLQHKMVISQLRWRPGNGQRSPVTAVHRGPVYTAHLISARRERGGDPGGGHTRLARLCSLIFPKIWLELAPRLRENLRKRGSSFGEKDCGNSSRTRAERRAVRYGDRALTETSTRGRASGRFRRGRRRGRRRRLQLAKKIAEARSSPYPRVRGCESRVCVSVCKRVCVRARVCERV